MARTLYDVPLHDFPVTTNGQKAARVSHQPIYMNIQQNFSKSFLIGLQPPLVIIFTHFPLGKLKIISQVICQLIKAHTHRGNSLVH